jgi:molybdopterin adenylyltransferase
MKMDTLKTGILTVSDRASKGIYEDKSGPAVKEFLLASIRNPLEVVYEIVADNYDDIKKALIHMADKQNCSLILTTGGTGPAPRDITPDVTLAVCSRILPGFGECMRNESLKYVATAILSRQLAGIHGSSLIINLPGNPRAVSQCLSAVFPAIPDCIKLIGGPVVIPFDNKISINH